jgi:N-acyl-D-aspartate/D-glutamate deacylase
MRQMLDLLIHGGTVVDGTGAAARRADVGIRGGRVVAIGEIDEPSVRTIDADGMMVAPGFVDLHTHYDAQLLWDPTASPSPLHGVTTVMGGNCGFSLAPTDPSHTGYLTRMMAKVEGMSRDALEEGLDWKWQSFGDYLDRLEGKISVNAGFLVGHSALRRAVMGDDAVNEEASSEQVAAMVGLLHQALEQGGLGFSTSTVSTHHDGELRPVPSRLAARSEFERLAAAVSEHPGTSIEMILQGCLRGFDAEEEDLMAALSKLANRPLNWNVLGLSSTSPERIEQQLHASDVAADRGATVVALSIIHNMPVFISFDSGVLLDGLPGWREMFALPPNERMAALSNPEVRRELEIAAASPAAGLLRARVANWPQMTIQQTYSKETAPYEGRLVEDIARERGQTPFDALLDIVVADELRTGLMPPTPESDADWEAGVKLWRDNRVVVGGSDAGAHLDMTCGAVYSTGLLEGAVRKRNLIGWEEAIAHLTDRPARLYGLRDRGRLAAGYWADVVVFDPESVGPGPVRLREDLPGGASRLYAESTGIEQVIVNGREIVAGGEFTGDVPGQLLRSGRDTDTVTAGTEWWTS